MLNYPANHIFVNKAINYASNRFRVNCISRRRISKTLCLRERQTILDQLKNVVGVWDEGIVPSINKDRCIFEADRAINHYFELLGFQGTISPLDWHLDSLSGFRWAPGRPFKKYKIIDLTNNADVKFPWELSRSHHMLWLGEAFLITKEEKYAREIVNQITDWISSNPYCRSINWTCSMEVAIRAVNWMYAVNMIQTSECVTDEFLLLFDKSVFQHGLYVYNNLEYSPTYNANHYVSNIIGLLYISSFYSGIKEAKKWHTFAQQEFFSEVRNQILPSGLHYENSIAYHRLVAELFICGYYCLLRNGCSIPLDIKSRLIHMLSITAYYSNSFESAPLIGDNDNGRFLPIIKRNYCDHNYLYDSLSAEQLFWSGGVPVLTIPDVNNQRDCRMVESGIAIMRNENASILISATGPSKYVELGKRLVSSHTHNDKLSFVLTIRGKDIIVDPGSYCYTSDIRLRNEFRSTKKHNTVIIDGEEQNTLPTNNAFAFEINSDIKTLELSQNDDTFECLGEYTTQKGEACHKRIFVLKNKELIIKDTVTKDGGGHSYDAFFHLGEDVKVVRNDNNSILLNKADIEISLKLNVEGLLSLELLKDTVSPEYGVKKDSISLRFHGEFADSITVQYLFRWE